MTYILKTYILAFLGATALTAQVSMAIAAGSDREPNTTNIFENTTPIHTSTQKNTVVTAPKGTGTLGNKTFLAQR